MIFLSSSTECAIRDFSMPLSTISCMKLKQPIFNNAHIVGNVNAVPGGGWQGTARFRFDFNHGGAREFANSFDKQLLQTASNPQVISTNVPFLVGENNTQENHPKHSEKPGIDDAPPTYDAIKVPTAPPSSLPSLPRKDGVLPTYDALFQIDS